MGGCDHERVLIVVKKKSPPVFLCTHTAPNEAKEEEKERHTNHTLSQIVMPAGMPDGV